MSRGYDFVNVCHWFAERADLILLLFDAHKLDISDEFKAVIERLKGQDDKIRVILNKADQVLTRVLGRGQCFATMRYITAWRGWVDRIWVRIRRWGLVEALSIEGAERVASPPSSDRRGCHLPYATTLILAPALPCTRRSKDQRRAISLSPPPPTH